jgi:hypothetical protein
MSTVEPPIYSEPNTPAQPAAVKVIHHVANVMWLEYFNVNNFEDAEEVD